jgi:hypothetical protein
MSSSKPVDPTALHALLELVRAQSPHPDHMTLAEAEAAAMTVWRQVGPQLIQVALDADKPATDEAEKKGHRRYAAGSRCGSGAGDTAP